MNGYMSSIIVLMLDMSSFLLSSPMTSSSSSGVIGVCPSSVHFAGDDSLGSTPISS